MPFARAEGLQLGELDMEELAGHMSQCPSLGPRGCNKVHNPSELFEAWSQCPSLGPRSCNLSLVTN
jgi:hypothetical protein